MHPPDLARSGRAHAVLWGDEHPDLGSLAALALDATTAIAISAGKMPKPYPHLDANEDAVLAATSPGATLLAVADGHNGFDAARAAVRAVADRLGALDPTPPGWAVDSVAVALLDAARQGVREALAAVGEERRRSRTALSLALISGGDLVVGGWGDTQVLRIRGRRARPVGSDGPFLDPSSETPEPERVRLRQGDVVLACSDGLRDYLAGDWAQRAAQIVAGSADAETAARVLVESAWAGGAGDHVSVAVTQWGD